MDMKIESVTPSRAEAWLNKNSGNRNMREGVAERYADDMRSGRWTTCPVPIAFYADGELADGQHRLWAIIDSGTMQTFPIARGLDRKDGLNLDTGLTRNIVDNAKISGVDPTLNNAIVGAARAVESGGPVTRGGDSYAAKLERVERHRVACEWAVASVRKTRFLCNAIVLGAVARAWYIESDKDRLKRFCDVLGTGMADGMGESAAVALRTYLLTKGPVSASSALWRDSFLKVQNCISLFMKGRQLTVIRKVEVEPYPLPKRMAKVVPIKKRTGTSQ